MCTDALAEGWPSITALSKRRGAGDIKIEELASLGEDGIKIERAGVKPEGSGYTLA